MAHRLLLVIGLCWLAAGGVGCDKKHPEPVQLPPPPAVVAHPIEREITDHQVFTARTQAVQSVDIKARVTGYLTKIAFTDGDEVKKDDILFQIDDRPYKATLDESIGSLDQATAALAEAKASLQLSRAALVKAQADYDIGLSVQKMNPGAVSEQEITKRLGNRDEAKASVEKATAGVPKAQGALEQAKASLAKAQLNYDWCTVKSPLSGRINRHFVDVGNLVTQDMTVLTNIVSLRPTWAYFDVDENTAENYQALVKEGKVKSARATEIPVEMSLGSDQRFPIKGVVDFISNQLDPSTGSIRMRAVFENKDGLLSAGMFARIRVPSSATHKALLVSDRAIGTDQGEKFILILNDKNEVERRSVAVGQLHAGLRAVKVIGSGKGAAPLSTSDRVIVDGLQRARPGNPVTPRLVGMMSQVVEAEQNKGK